MGRPASAAMNLAAIERTKIPVMKEPVNDTAGHRRQPKDTKPKGFSR
jgi:hypothetical protein